MPHWISRLVGDAAIDVHDVRAAGIDRTSQHSLDLTRRLRVGRAAVRASAMYWIDALT